MSDEAPLGTYIISYYIPKREVSYEQTIQVKEFTKPNYEIRIALNTSKDIVMSVDPQYYFGAPVEEYSLGVSATLIPQKNCRYCRWNAEQEEDGYTNFQFNTAPSDRMDVSLLAQAGVSSVLLRKYDDLPDTTATYDLVGDVVIVDKKTGERQTKQITETITSPVTLNLPGRPIERIYDIDKVLPLSLSMSGEIDEVKKTVASWYYEPYGYQTETGVDGAIYTIA